MSDSDDLLEMLVDQMDRLCVDLIDRDLLASVERGEAPKLLIGAIEEFGVLDALAFPPEDGGLSLDAAASIFALLGAHAVPLPIGETMLARCVLARAGIEAPQGLTGFVDLEEGAASIAHGGLVSHVVAGRDGQVCLFAVADLATEAAVSISRGGRRTVDARNPTPIALAPWPADLPDALTLGAMLRASEIAGALNKALALSVEYANTRNQFGRPIGRFQAVQQLLAKLAGEAAAARSVADAAWHALAAGKLGWAGAIAKVRTGEAARAGAAIAHQVHGAIGVTDEHMLHYFTRRLWEWRLDFGSDGFWAERLGKAARAAPTGLWNFIIAHDGAPEQQEVVA